MKSTPLQVAEDESQTIRIADVLCGRGRVEHGGNAYFRSTVNRHLADYIRFHQKKNRHGMSAIIQLIIDEVHHSGGRFLDQHWSGMWVELSEKERRLKVDRAFRDAKKNAPSKVVTTNGMIRGMVTTTNRVTKTNPYMKKEDIPFPTRRGIMKPSSSSLSFDNIIPERNISNPNQNDGRMVTTTTTATSVTGSHYNECKPSSSSSLLVQPKSTLDTTTNNNNKNHNILSTTYQQHHDPYQPLHYQRQLVSDVVPCFQQLHPPISLYESTITHNLHRTSYHHSHHQSLRNKMSLPIIANDSNLRSKKFITEQQNNTIHNNITSSESESLSSIVPVPHPTFHGTMLQDVPVPLSSSSSSMLDDTLFGDRALFDVLLMDDHFGTMRGLHDDTTSITTANRNNNNNNDECYHHEHRQHRRSSISSDTTDNNNVILDCSYRSSTFF